DPQRTAPGGTRATSRRSMRPQSKTKASTPLAPGSKNQRSNGKQHSSVRRDEIVAIAAKMFAERGFAGTTIRDIGERADILSGSLYHHFRSKESIADAILSAYWDDLLELVDAVEADKASDAVAKVKALMQASATMFGK